MKEKVQAELKTNFRPEFLNRIDATVVFRSLTVEEITKIVDLMLKRVRDQLKAQGMTLEITQAAKEHLIKLGYDQAYGARPLRRTIQNLIEDPLAEHLLLGRYNQGDTIVVDLDPDGNGLTHRGHRGEDAGRSLTPGRRVARVARVQSRFVCQSCGAAVPRWEGQCRTCGEWNTLVETVVRDEPRRRPVAVVGGAVPVALLARG